MEVETDIAWLAWRDLPEWVPLTSMNGMALRRAGFSGTGSFRFGRRVRAGPA